MDKAAREKARELCDAFKHTANQEYLYLRQALDALDAADSDNARLRAQAATNTRCKWGGGNDYLACRTCGLEYDYRKEERPACGAEATITRLQARVAELEAAQRWQSIESAPKDGTEILTVGIDSEHVVATKWLSPGPYVRTPNRNFYKDEGWYWSGWDGAVGPVRPTIWRPLPAPPVGDR